MRAPASRANDPLQVLVYTTQVRYGGGYENLALGLATQLHARGESVFLLTHYSDECVPAHHTCLPRAVPSDLPSASLEVPVRPSLTCCVRAAVRLRRLVRDLGVNTIEVSGDGPSFLACLATIGLKVKVVLGVHYVTERRSHPILKRLFWILIAATCRHVWFYGVSRSATSAWIDYCKASPKRVSTVFNSIDESFFDARTHALTGRLRQEIGCAQDERIILCIGRLMRCKAQDVVLTALEPLLTRHRLRLVFVGRTDTEPGDDGATIAAMRAKVDTSDLQRYVHFLGQRHDIPELLAHTDLVVHVPHKEAFGLVLAEAMASGVPIIASDVEGIPEVVEGTDTMLVPAGDPLALRDAVTSWVNWHPSRRDRSIRRGLERAQMFRDTVRTSSIITVLRSSATRRPR